MILGSVQFHFKRQMLIFLLRKLVTKLFNVLLSYRKCCQTRCKKRIGGVLHTGHFFRSSGLSAHRLQKLPRCHSFLPFYGRFFIVKTQVQSQE